MDEATGNTLVSGLAAMQGWRVEMEVSGRDGASRGRAAQAAGRRPQLSARRALTFPHSSARPPALRQDAHAMTAEVPGEPTYSFFGVFDGHGGKYISDCAARDLLLRIQGTEEWKSGARDVETVKAALRSGFIKLDEELKASEEVVTRDDHSGSTAVTALVTPTHIFVANCGDSRSIMVSDGAAIEMSHDHKPYLEAETKRIEEAGGTVAMKRVNGDLAVSRALGDFVYKRSANLPPEKQQVSCEPVGAPAARPGAAAESRRRRSLALPRTSRSRLAPQRCCALCASLRCARHCAWRRPAASAAPRARRNARSQPCALSAPVMHAQEIIVHVRNEAKDQ